MACDNIGTTSERDPTATLDAEPILSFDSDFEAIPLENGARVVDQTGMFHLPVSKIKVTRFLVVGIVRPKPRGPLAVNLSSKQLAHPRYPYEWRLACLGWLQHR